LGHELLAVNSDQDKVQQILPHVTKAAVADVSNRPVLGHLVIAGRPPNSGIGKTVSALAWPERHGVSLLTLCRPAKRSRPRLRLPIAETDMLILAGHIDRLRELREVK
jgi:hypothetical protein